MIGATHYQDGLFLKVGRFGKVFYHTGLSWRLSSKKESELEGFRIAKDDLVRAKIPHFLYN
jgi:hypothetical protein